MLHPLLNIKFIYTQITWPSCFRFICVDCVASSFFFLFYKATRLSMTVTEPLSALNCKDLRSFSQWALFLPKLLLWEDTLYANKCASENCKVQKHHPQTMRRLTKSDAESHGPDGPLIWWVKGRNFFYFPVFLQLECVVLNLWYLLLSFNVMPNFQHR